MNSKFTISFFIFIILSLSIISIPSTFADETKVVIDTNPDFSYGGEYGMNEGGGIPVAVIIEGDLQNNGHVKLLSTGIFRASFPMTLEANAFVSTGNSKHLFYLDYGFKKDESYTLTAINGDAQATIEWIPLPSDTNIKNANSSVSENANSSVSENANSSVSENGKIRIQGETHPVITKGSPVEYKYSVEVISELEFNYSINDFGGWLKNGSQCFEGTVCPDPDKIFLITEDSKTYNFSENFNYVWENSEWLRDWCLSAKVPNCTGDFKPEIITFAYQYEDESVYLNIYPKYVEYENTISDKALEKIHTRSIYVKGVLPASMDDRWYALVEICSGERALSKPSLVISSDIETAYYVLPVSINKLSCTQQEVQVKAMNPETIFFEFETIENGNDEEIDQLKEELDALKKMLQAEEIKPKVPVWIKNNVQWWANGQVDDQTFMNGIEFMVKDRIIEITNLPEQTSNTSEKEIPDWIRNNAIWWSEGVISEDDFINGIEFLVQKGIISIN